MRRVVVTGLGMVTPLGCGVEITWQRLLAGQSGARRVESFDVSDLPAKIACQLPRGDGSDGTFNPDQWMEPKEQRKVDDFIVYAMAAARQALDDADWHPSSYDDQCATGVMIGSGIGGLQGIAETALLMQERGPRRVSPFFIPGRLINLAGGYVSIEHGLKGPNHAVVTACSTGAHAIGDAARLVAFGDADVMVAGGTESSINRLGLAGFAACRALSTSYNDTPEKASRPYDKDRDGFVMGEGAGVVVVEALDHALARGAKILGVVEGVGEMADSFHRTRSSPDAKPVIGCMRNALADAGVDPDAIDYINAHGTSTPENDRMEFTGMSAVFGERLAGIPISSNKSMIGHTLTAAGAIEAVVSLMTIANGRIPPTINYEIPDPAIPLDVVPNVARDAKVTRVMSNSFGFGGQNVCLILTGEPA
ncbi:MAG: beta-ketoacyl-[acyl-carrier-protein] synthase II [Starkeya sp.]|nr:beta-ketoacyl-[acyl-carrier-protein] synthase II [Starkeya sp.]